MNNKWNCIIITCPAIKSVIAIEKEIKFLQAKNRISRDVPILTIEDPGENIGSGAATLNALLVAAEYLSAQQNFAVVTADVLHEARVLILHNGRNNVYCCPGKAFISLPQEWTHQHYCGHKEDFCTGVMTNLESILILVDKISQYSPYGVWICSTDMMIIQREKSLSMNWDNVTDAVMFCIPADIHYATNHGVVGVDEMGFVSDIVYCGSPDRVKRFRNQNGTVPLVSGIVYLSSTVAESLLSLHAQSPLDSCTYLGSDSGAQPIQVSLFFDILVAMSSSISEDEFISGKCGKTYNSKVGFSDKHSRKSFLARSLVWKELSKYRMIPKIFHECQHIYWANQCTGQNYIDNFFKISPCGLIHSRLKGSNSSVKRLLVINSVIEVEQTFKVGDGTVICDSELSQRDLNIGKNCIISGVTEDNKLLSLQLPNNAVFLKCHISNLTEVSFVALFGTNDDLMLPFCSPNATFFNEPWFYLFERISIETDDLWSQSLKKEEKSLLTAKLFPAGSSFKNICFLSPTIIPKADELMRWRMSERYSLEDALQFCDYSKYFNHKRNISAQITFHHVQDVLSNSKDDHLLPYFRATCAEGYHKSIINTLDSILMKESDATILTRTLSSMADLLSIMADKSGGLRSGPGANKSWIVAFEFLLNGQIQDGMLAMQKERANWLDKPDHLIRAARHYERAAQILIQNAVKSVKENIKLGTMPLPDYDIWITAECPVRIDLQGGWTDTPPICYELGGSVINIAVTMDCKPVGAAACRTKEPVILLKLGRDETCTDILITEMSDILDYDKPSAPGALLKAALICTEILDIHVDLSLEHQLLKRFGGGFIVKSWSLLPQGCGMGTSSILAGAIISVLWSVSGKVFDKLSVIHAVLYLEQLLTTGGGWQDQVSGVIGGVNRGFSKASLPLTIGYEPLVMSPELIEKLNSHLLLIYTGKVRLAKNILQNVVRNWYAREKTIVSCFNDLISHSLEMKEALLKGNFEKIGFLMNKYWEQKKLLAPGCEPIIVKHVMEKLTPLCYGKLLVGAGGGGFMCVLTKQPNKIKEVKEVINSLKAAQKMIVHPVSVNLQGLELTGVDLQL